MAGPQMERLLEVTVELAAAESEAAVGQIVVERGLGRLWLVDPTTRTLGLLGASRPAERWQTMPIELDAPLAEVARSGVPMFLARAEYEARYPAAFARMRDTLTSPDPGYANLPVLAGGQPVGALAVTYEHSAELDAAERTFLAILANQCGQALGRIRATEATQAREEILSVVSHDLRNPLGTILMGASTLLQIAEGDDVRSQKICAIAERVQRQSERMARMIDTLVDFGGLQANKLAIATSPTTIEAIVTRAAALFGPMARERGLAFEAASEPTLPSVTCDGERIVQVLMSLCGNALKVTPKQGRIAIGARLVAGEVVLSVTHSGPGIAADELPLVFAGYWRSKHASYRGNGLGVAIAKGIIDLHGGRIWVESEPDRGSAFLFTVGPPPAGLP
ncbi:MAG: ATP-binding protein [Kofleriaceae bacterium]